MKNIIINLSNSANKFFKKHIDIYDKFINNLKSVYNNNNTNIDIKAMKNYNIYRMRIQKYRVIYKIINEEIIIIEVITAGNKSEIYKNFQ